MSFCHARGNPVLGRHNYSVEFLSRSVSKQQYESAATVANTEQDDLDSCNVALFHLHGGYKQSNSDSGTLSIESDTMSAIYSLRADRPEIALQRLHKDSLE